VSDYLIMDYLWVAVAFIFGFLAKYIKLPPLVGYLAAGFGLNAIAVEPDSYIDTFVNIELTHCFFILCLTLNISSFFHNDIWAGG